MTYWINETHDSKVKSFIESANIERTDFPIQNLPFGIVSDSAQPHNPFAAVAIGDQVLSLPAAYNQGLFDGTAAVAAESCLSGTLNQLMSLDNTHWSILRSRLLEILRIDSPNLEKNKSKLENCLLPQSRVELHKPAEIGDYTDFYASIHHATNVGKLFRPDNPLLPNYKYVPIAYHGRSSSIVVSGTKVRRPSGQIKGKETEIPEFRPSQRLDYEMELGLFIGLGNTFGEPVTLDHAGAYIFGLCLVNDWSARDLQAWEYQPLGPFLAKNFATTISPWIVTLEALEPFRTNSFKRAETDPEPLPYLHSAYESEHGGIDLNVEVYISSQKMRESGIADHRISLGNFQSMYWTINQMVTHHTSNGCNLRPGDLLASGTISGEERGNFGCLLEITSGGKVPIELPSGETRRFLEDGDEIIMRAWCERQGFARIGFGECRGRIIGV
jgi:fumarylacetoacetase